MKKYKCGLIIGRFQPIHNGHVALIREALDQCEYLIIGIGSAEEFETKRNPISFGNRKNFVEYVVREIIYERAKLHNIPEEIHSYNIIPLVNIGAGDSPVWGNYVMNTCKLETVGSHIPEVYFSGTEIDRNHWFDNYDMKFEVIDRDEIKVSATQVRELIINNDKSWKKLVPKCLTNPNNWYADYFEITIKRIKEAYKND